MQETTGIIGSGIGGLAAAVRLSSDGYQVTVFEKNGRPGGKINQLKGQGYRFDTGPTVFTMPELIDELFLKAGKQTSSYLSYKSLDQSCRYFWEDGTLIDAYSEGDRFINELVKKTGESGENLNRFLNKSKELYDLTANIFVFNSIHERKNLFTKDSLKALLNIHRIDALTTMHEVNRKRFSSEKTVQLFDRYATYNGSSPYRAPGTLNIIPHLEHNMGVYFPDKGMYSIVESLHQLAKEQGVKFHFSEPVKKLEVSKNKVDRLITSKGTYGFNHVINDSDVNYFYSHLLQDNKLLKKTLKPEKSSSALILFWGINTQFPDLKLHNILFSEDYEAEFEYLFQRRLIYYDPTVYIFIGSKELEGEAPKGHENWYVMINVPENTGQNWANLKKEARKNILIKINRMLSINIENHIEYEEIMDPVTIERDTSSWHGSLYGNSSNGRAAAFNRHPNFSKKYKNLYFTGGSVHPGGGIPLCLASAKIVEKKILSS
jgi:phytoene desaturase